MGALSLLCAGPVVGTWSCGQVTIQCLQVFEHTNAGQRLNNGENLLDLGLHIEERGMAAAARNDLFARDLEEAQSSTADEFEVGQVEYQIVEGSGKDRGHLALQIRCCGGVEAASEFDGDHACMTRICVLLDLNVQGHKKGRLKLN